VPEKSHLRKLPTTARSTWPRSIYDESKATKGFACKSLRRRTILNGRALVDDFELSFPVQKLILTASVIWRDSIAAQVPDQNSRMSWRKAAPA
jgi:hypothetical protein